MNAEKTTIRLVIGSHLQDVHLIGMAIHRLALGKGFPEMSAFALELCVVEAVTNAIEHAYKGEPGNDVQVDLLFQEDNLVLEVCDWGKPMDGALLQEATCQKLHCDHTHLDNLSERGRGLAIIKEIMDSVSYRSDQGVNCLTMVKKLPGKEPSAQEEAMSFSSSGAGSCAALSGSTEVS